MPKTKIVITLALEIPADQSAALAQAVQATLLEMLMPICDQLKPTQVVVEVILDNDNAT